MYDHEYLNAEFNYDDLEAQYADKQRNTPADPEGLKKELDQNH